MKTSFVWLLALCLSAGCFGSTAEAVYPTEAAATPPLATFGPGDEITVRVFYGASEMERPYTIGPSGDIGFPFIGTIKVAGRTQSEVEQEIQSKLADGYLKDPMVSIEVEEVRSQKISVFGQINTPGTLAFADGMTIVEAISQAGGFTQLARKDAVTVTRTKPDGTKQRYVLPVEQIAESRAENFLMQPGDIVLVPQRRW